MDMINNREVYFSPGIYAKLHSIEVVFKFSTNDKTNTTSI